MAVIKIEDLTYYYPDTAKPALKKINLEIPEGQFVLVAGGSGSGKSTLIRAICGLIPEFYGGRFGGSIYIDGADISELDRRSVVSRVGMVFQDPESQLVMNGVEQEVVFGLENLGMPPDLIRRRAVETIAAFGLIGCLQTPVRELSGGQKQKVALASVLAVQPEVLLLDEPTSQLDPVSAEEILGMIKRLNEDNGITVVLVEQRMERCFHMADRVLVMDRGSITADYNGPEKAARRSAESDSAFVPPIPRLFAVAGFKEVPLTVKQGRQVLKSLCPAYGGGCRNARKTENTKKAAARRENPVAEIENAWFTYPDGNEALKNISLKIYPGDFTAVMGENAAGKTTLLKLLTGLLKPGRGRVRVFGRDTRSTSASELAGLVGYLSQNPGDYLFLPSVKEELAFTLENLGINDVGRCEEILDLLKLSRYSETNPRDLSTGERQRAALAAVLVARPGLLLLDEPTRGLDYRLKAELGRFLAEFSAGGNAVLVVTHDVEFAAEFAQKIILMSQGTIAGMGDKHEMLTDSAFYSPQVNRLFRGIDDGVVTGEEAVRALARIMEYKKRGERLNEA